MIPIRDTLPRRGLPAVTIAIIFANAIVFVREAGLPPRALEAMIHVLGLVPERFVDWTDAGGAPLDPLRFVPLVASMFMHGSWLHIAGNMLYLWVFGDNVEALLGHGRFLAFYFLCGIAAAFGQVLANPESTAPMVGASGAIAGVLGAYFVSFPRARIVTLIPLFFWPLFVEIPALVFLGVWFLMQLLSGLLTLDVPTLSSGVAFWVHASGFLAGVVFLLVFRPRRRGRAETVD